MGKKARWHLEYEAALAAYKGEISCNRRIRKELSPEAQAAKRKRLLKRSNASIKLPRRQACNAAKNCKLRQIRQLRQDQKADLAYDRRDFRELASADWRGWMHCFARPPASSAFKLPSLQECRERSMRNLIPAADLIDYGMEG